jgi:tRNA modification GTPase
MDRETIFALATAAGRAAVAVIRLSGPGSGAALDALGGKRPAPRRAAVRQLRDIDQALVLWFPGPASYTGEDSAELHLHGGPAVVESALTALAALGLRQAEPGEFTRRAFENGKLDLAQAEAVADLIDAETKGQAHQALQQLGGALSKRHDVWRAALLESLALLEAGVDFPDEELPDDLVQGARRSLTALLDELNAALLDQERGRQVREGFHIAIIGAPNAGKSSVFNAILQREAAIVTAVAGTTRDVLEAPLVIAGYKVVIADTAGVRETEDEIESEGVRRATRSAEEADLRFWVVDQSADSDPLHGVEALVQPGDVLVLNKADAAAGRAASLAKTLAAARGLSIFSVVARRGDGLADLLAAVEGDVVAAVAGREFPAATRQRHLESLTTARDRLVSALDARENELAAEDVRLAARALGRITGQIDPEEILGAVFGKFCIGK